MGCPCVSGRAGCPCAVRAVCVPCACRVHGATNTPRHSAVHLRDRSPFRSLSIRASLPRTRTLAPTRALSSRTWRHSRAATCSLSSHRRRKTCTLLIRSTSFRTLTFMERTLVTLMLYEQHALGRRVRVLLRRRGPRGAPGPGALLSPARYAAPASAATQASFDGAAEPAATDTVYSPGPSSWSAATSAAAADVRDVS